MWISASWLILCCIFSIWSWVYCTWQASSLHPIKKLHYSLNHYFPHMLLWFKEFVTAAGIDASLCNTDPMCHWSLCLRVEHVTLSLCESLWQSGYSTIYCVLRYTGCTVFYQNAEHFFFCILTFSWISWWLIQRWRRGRWSTNTQPFSRGWVPIFVSLRLTK